MSNQEYTQDENELPSYIYGEDGERLLAFSPPFLCV
jgi:hypothetical protein